ncbi:unnamed protein product [marine sediment metagenome]|uniref:Uncharacterized protein n=1 Tax=marine sediment metagenome TaxID=412755 RepID=X1C6F2_9ZZZZ
MEQVQGQVGQCKLCQQQAVLRCSHVVSEFCYKPIYHGKHKLVEARVSVRGFRRKISQKGYKEPMLCECCEQKLNAWETPFRNFWYANVISSGAITEKYPVVGGFDYKWMKLFHLSVIWRLHSADGFGRIDLGPYAERIRNMLLNEKAGSVGSLPVLGCLLLNDDNSIMDKLITEPGVAHCDGSHFYAVSYAGCEWLFLMTETPTRKQQELIDAFGIQEDGSIRLMTSHYKRSRSMSPSTTPEPCRALPKSASIRCCDGIR